MKKKVAIIGCGAVGFLRAQSVSPAVVTVCADTLLQNAERLAACVGNACVATTDWRRAIHDVDIVIVAVPHKYLPEITLAAIQAGKHVLVEKPAARCAHELLALIEAAKHAQVLVRVGFNHRYHRGFRQAHALVHEQALGELLFLRARYGHGGRLGYEKEWRANPDISGGGELIDQGVHLIDLARWFLGDFNNIQGSAETYFWDMPVDDNAFMLLKTPKKQTAFLHVSCTEWKNTFSFELYGKKGKLEISGLGGSYGVERLSFYQMLPEMGPPQTTIWEYPMQDDSWAVEFNTFLEDIQHHRQPDPTLWDAHQALMIVSSIAKASGYDYHA